jgi:hypothetical protein
MVLSDVERDITKTVVQRFLNMKQSSPRGLFSRRFRSSQAFYQLTGWNILANAKSGGANLFSAWAQRFFS